MTEHVHEWKWLSGYSKEQKAHISGIMCLCGEQMSIKEAEARLNATERLSAKNARRARYGYQYTDVDEALTAYADILEGKQ